MKQFLYGVCFFMLLSDAYAGGGSSFPAHCKDYTKSSSTTKWPDNQPCPDDGVVSDLFACGYKNKWDNRGLSEAEANRADYCMFQKGYHYRARPDFRPICEIRPIAPGCADVLWPSKDISD